MRCISYSLTVFVFPDKYDVGILTTQNRLVDLSFAVTSPLLKIQACCLARNNPLQERNAFIVNTNKTRGACSGRRPRTSGSCNSIWRRRRLSWRKPIRHAGRRTQFQLRGITKRRRFCPQPGSEGVFNLKYTAPQPRDDRVA